MPIRRQRVRTHLEIHACSQKVRPVEVRSTVLAWESCHFYDSRLHAGARRHREITVRARGSHRCGSHLWRVTLGRRSRRARRLFQGLPQLCLFTLRPRHIRDKPLEPLLRAERGAGVRDSLRTTCIILCGAGSSTYCLPRSLAYVQQPPVRNLHSTLRASVGIQDFLRAVTGRMLNDITCTTRAYGYNTIAYGLPRSSRSIAL